MERKYIPFNHENLVSEDDEEMPILNEFYDSEVSDEWNDNFLDDNNNNDALLNEMNEENNDLNNENGIEMDDDKNNESKLETNILTDTERDVIFNANILKNDTKRRIKVKRKIRKLRQNAKERCKAANGIKICFFLFLFVFFFLFLKIFFLFLPFANLFLHYYRIFLLFCSVFALLLHDIFCIFFIILAQTLHAIFLESTYLCLFCLTRKIQ